MFICPLCQAICADLVFLSKLEKFENIIGCGLKLEIDKCKPCQEQQHGKYYPEQQACTLAFSTEFFPFHTCRQCRVSINFLCLCAGL